MRKWEGVGWSRWKIVAMVMSSLAILNLNYFLVFSGNVWFCDIILQHKDIFRNLWDENWNCKLLERLLFTKRYPLFVIFLNGIEVVLIYVHGPPWKLLKACSRDFSGKRISPSHRLGNIYLIRTKEKTI
jgi:hypothetical protein